MPYDALEILGGEPVELFKFVYGDDVWHWTSGVESVTKNGDTYSPAAMVSGTISADSEAMSNSVTIRTTLDNPVVTLFREHQLAINIAVTIFRKQRDDPEFVSVFVGEVATVRFLDTEAELTCQPVQSITQRKLAALTYQATCNNRLYDNRCQVVRADFTYTYPVAAITPYNSELIIELGGGAGAFFTGDKLNWLAAGTVLFEGELMMITEHTGDQIITLGIIRNLIVGDILTLYAGCDRKVQTCRDKFDNLPRHQGFPFTPADDPADDGFHLNLPNFGNPF